MKRLEEEAGAAWIKTQRRVVVRKLKEIFYVTLYWKNYYAGCL